MTHPALPVLTTSGHGESRRGSHRLADAKNCARKWFLRYDTGLRPNEQKQILVAGTLGHRTIAQLYGEMIIEQGKWPKPTWWEDGRSLRDILNELGEGHPDLIPNAYALYAAYKSRWIECDMPEVWEPVAVEEQFWSTIDVLDPHPDGPDADPLKGEIVTSGIDLVVRNTTNDFLYIVDHKSKGFDPFVMWQDTKRIDPWVRDSTGGGDWEKYAISWQSLVNLHLVRRAFPNHVVAGFFINRFTRDQPFVFDRHKLKISKLAYAEAPRAARSCIEEEKRILGMVAAGEKPVANFGNCYGPYGLCDYINICSASSDDEARAVAAEQFHIV